VYAINNAKLFRCTAGTPTTTVTPGDRPTAASLARSLPSEPAMGQALSLLGTGLLIAAAVAARRLRGAWA
jgi:hypothetical protein